MTIYQSEASESAQYKRALGALQGLALGDALGMPTQSMSHEDIRRAYGDVIGLNDAIPNQPIAPNMKAGSVTDDTEQALIVAQLIIDGHGHIDSLQLAHRLLDWEDDMIKRGSRDLLGPSTKIALEQIRNGADSRMTGRTGTTNGAAMRVTPVGIANRPTDVENFASRIYESCKVTHNTVQGFEAAALVASAVSIGIEGAPIHDAIEEGISVVEQMRLNVDSFDYAWSPKADVIARTRNAIKITQRPTTDDEFLASLRKECGTSVESNESIPAAFAIAWRFSYRSFAALCAAASIGGDTDTIAAMCGAILGACGGADDFPQDALNTIDDVSHLNLSYIARELLRERRNK